MPHNTTISPEELSAIVNGYHGDPFRILGRHTIAETTFLRAFEPTAEFVNALQNGQSYPLSKIDPRGFFEGVIPDPLAPYILEIGYQGSTLQRADAYSIPTTFSELDLYLLGEGTDMEMYNKLGAQLMQVDGIWGTRFGVWAPNAERVSVVGGFNQWDGRRNPMRYHPGAGVWELFVPGVRQGELYKYEIKTRYKGYMVKKSDPVGFFAEVRPNTASIVWDINSYQWQDQAWLANRPKANSVNAPISIYELHLGSWQRGPYNSWLTYDEMIERIIPYVKWLGHTHIELLPIAEHPFDGSWGYQVTGYFAPTSRFGTPNDFMRFVDACHQNGIGVIVDWVPAHFPKDAHGLSFFDGTHLYEHADPRKGEHPDWGTLIFNFDRNEVRQFLISNAIFLAEKYHIDGLRVDAVASMLYLDFSRKEGEWVPNIYGGRENIGAINFLREFNDRLHQKYPDVLTIAEESTAWGGVTSPTSNGGLGFDFKWNMGWMNDTLRYFSNDPIYRTYHHGTITFSLIYAFSEKFVLPLSHDEVVHLKNSLISKMPGDNWQKFANLRLLYGYMWTHPGKKLLFMGGEFAQWSEWSEAFSLDWHLVQENWPHGQMQKWLRALNHLYVEHSAMHEIDSSWEGFEWLEVHDSAQSILAYLRRNKDGQETIIVACNFTPVVRHGYRLGVPAEGHYQLLLNSDSADFGGSGVVEVTGYASQAQPWQNQPASIMVTLPPLGMIILAKEEG